jgi:hypothetical protein
MPQGGHCQCNGKNTSAQFLLTQISPKQLLLWRDIRERKMEEIHRELQDLDPIGSPHLEEIDACKMHP